METARPTRRKALAALIGISATCVVALVAGCGHGDSEAPDSGQTTPEADPTSQVQDSTPTTATPPTVSDRDLEIVTVLAKDAIPAIRSPEFVGAADAEEWMNADEPVIGVEIEGDARAYPVAMLSRHEIVNDMVGGAPIAVTW